MNCFCGMVDWQKAFSLISSRDHRQRSSPSWISDTLRVGFEPAQNLSSGFVEWRFAVVITTTPWCHCWRPLHKGGINFFKIDGNKGIWKVLLEKGGKTKWGVCLDIEGCHIILRLFWRFLKEHSKKNLDVFTFPLLTNMCYKIIA